MISFQTKQAATVAQRSKPQHAAAQQHGAIGAVAESDERQQQRKAGRNAAGQDLEYRYCGRMKATAATKYRSEIFPTAAAARK